jgi:pyruvate ferredoxin oxidoreductase alpha subunit
VLKVRSFRPYPGEQIKEALGKAAAVGELDRAISFGLGGPLFHVVRSALYGDKRPLLNFIYGLGGREILPEQIESVYADLAAACRSDSRANGRLKEIMCSPNGT